MFHLKLTAFALGAATTLGFVWLARARKQPSRKSADANQLARRDAFQAFAADADTELDPTYEDPNIDVERFDEEPLPIDEHYDAVDPEDIGSEWLSRAIESPSSRSEQSRFSEDGDALEEIPVGHVDTDGNTELHPPKRPSKAPVDLSPNDEELAQRAAENPGEDAAERHE